MTQEEQPPQKIGIQSDSGDINIEQSQVNIAGRDINITVPPSKATVRERRARKMMLDQVERIWITGFLQQSLYEEVLITLGLREKLDAIANPWRMTLQELEQPVRDLPLGTHIIEVYDDANGALLILGEPGSGKTTLLLELTRDLLTRARSDDSDSHPIPVVFRLSSWAMKRQPLAEWLVEELDAKYYVPRNLGKIWIDEERVLPLLDGLDEVTEAECTACIRAINAYRHEHGLVPLVVCSRSTEYLRQPMQLHLHSAVVVQPLIFQQIDDALSRVGEQLGDLRIALNNDLVLQELASTPLMLGILMLTYHGKSVEKLPQIGSLEQRRQQIWTKYIQRMFQRQRANIPYTSQRTIFWLIWLAYQMLQHGQTDFYIEGLQADWLPAYWSRLTYHTLIGTIFGIDVFLAFATFFRLFILFDFVKVGLVVGVAIGTIGGLVIGLRGGPASSIQPAEAITWSFASFRESLFPRLRRGFREKLLGALVFGEIVGVIGGFFIELRNGLLAGLILGVIIWLMTVLMEQPDPSVQTPEGVQGVIESVRRTWLLLLSGGLIAAVRGGLVAGLSSKTLNPKERRTPNQGIWRSARHAAIIALIFALVFGPLFGLIGLLIFGPSKVWTFVLGGVLSSGLLSLLFFGGEACVKHVILRLLLWQTGMAPWNYPRFLDYADERILLRKVGGGYVFIHKLLLEHFAARSERSI